MQVIRDRKEGETRGRGQWSRVVQFATPEEGSIFSWSRAATRDGSTPGVDQRWVNSIWYACIFYFLYSHSLCAYCIFYILCIFYIIHSTHTRIFSIVADLRVTRVCICFLYSKHVYFCIPKVADLRVISVCTCVLYSMYVYYVF